jgi:putative oxidoreductase
MPMSTAEPFTSWSAQVVAFDAVVLGAGLLVARLVLGLLMAAHGAQKLFGWFGGYGLGATAGFFEQIGFRPGRLFAALAAGTELASGLLVALGLLGPIGPALMLSVMIVAAVSVHWRHGVFATANGIELTLVYGAAAFALALTGPGLFSLDAALGIASLWTSRVALAALAVGIVGGIANLAARRPAPAPTAGDAQPAHASR